MGKQSWPSVKSGFLQIKWAIGLTCSLEIEPKKAPEGKTFPGLESYRPDGLLHQDHLSGAAVL
ncbi:MAG TPA: hypothetical protein PL102_03260, partial [Candidatus Syntrophosphaera sp.]|nr:hypothetical protein [Candidatus Syntrophosphaera sp.]